MNALTRMQRNSHLCLASRWTLTVVLAVLMAASQSSSADESALTREQTASTYRSAKFGSFDPHHPPPSGHPSVFSLSQDFPTSIPQESYPWEEIDFVSDPRSYMKVVLDYCLEGNLEADFRVQDNKIRKWYHAPWLHDDGDQCGNGREYHHGLTRERGTPPKEIHLRQDVPLENWAVGFYNAPGGFILGRVWPDAHKNPEPGQANFPNGTVSCKLLFTDGGPPDAVATDKVPFLKGTFEWTGNIYRSKPYRRESDQKICESTERTDRPLYLIQLDIAVKDPDAKDTGWVFGTFMYDASAKGQTPWDRLVPVGLSWGNDPKVTADMTKDGAFINPRLRQNWLNNTLIRDAQTALPELAYVRYHGIGGRLNGPVDNPISSCVSCHGQAAVTAAGESMPLGAFSTSRDQFTNALFEKFFSNVKPGTYLRTFDGKTYTTVDYSLQLSAGIRNYYKDLATRFQSMAKSLESSRALEGIPSLGEVNRGED